MWLWEINKGFVLLLWQRIIKKTCTSIIHIVPSLIPSSIFCIFLRLSDSPSVSPPQSLSLHLLSISHSPCHRFMADWLIDCHFGLWKSVMGLLFWMCLTVRELADYSISCRSPKLILAKWYKAADVWFKMSFIDRFNNRKTIIPLRLVMIIVWTINSTSNQICINTQYWLETTLVMVWHLSEWEYGPLCS